MFENPFNKTLDTDRHSIWLMLVEKDILAFGQSDWDLIASDFYEDGFTGVDCCHSNNPDHWKLNFPSLNSYSERWKKRSAEITRDHQPVDLIRDLYDVTLLNDIDINGNEAIAHKKFNGHVRLSGESDIVMNWQTLYYLRKMEGIWKITGFIGYLPFEQ
ncbi:hypothetical protein GZ77_14090 [Endozoicomonas montiporae]|uniref:SnoaL-like domain-containing protein n=2 Tax=Endozoicomonas montiporae TaxID=1027273 RepID=A0A081N4W2_9GAMM|nr:hypothetical protein [Endozoicomonas montiporae]AMO57641.1 hypothetical protein EZMO1_3680 [Endozoicomonas montiporae CL-33]KEQ13485.1 hypothetical protein GZ77_14065 [Endozoicomonas montiporae]KEQ13489.1 hypothetical protein GZ77_14090 [Endozoicomonas montiporae]